MKILISGGAGFIGVHAAYRFAKRHTVHIVDNCARMGTEANLDWLRSQCRYTHAKIDIRNATKLESEIKNFQPDVVLHLAAQVAVTTSVLQPKMDFEVNALGTVNLLEAVRQHVPKCVFLFASTNKVYGEMEGVGVALRGKRYEYSDLPHGISEKYPLDFHSPYGCSKGSADQYVHDYARIYGLRSAVFRQSCIYGTHQFGVEDQGWLAWFTICAAMGRPITLYGDGQQVRDVLWVEDLIDVFEMAAAKIDFIKGQVFNIGGGPKNQLSLLETITLLEKFTGHRIPYQLSQWRPGDQKVFIADIRKAEKVLGWVPKVEPALGLKRLYHWVTQNRSLFESTTKMTA